MVLESWLDKRREQELERINRELEELKKRGLGYAPPQQRPPSKPFYPRQSPAGAPYARGPRFFDFKTTTLIILFLIILGITFFLQRGEIKEQQNLAKGYYQDLKDLQAQVEDAESSLEEHQELLEEKSKEGADLNAQFESLNELNAQLQDEIDDLETQKKDILSTIEDLEEEVLSKKSEVNFYKACITDEDLCGMSLTQCGDFNG